MCDICLRQFCPPACPGYKGSSAAFGDAIGQCDLCQASIYKGERFFSDGERLICDQCAEYLSVDDICAVCGFKSREELLATLGLGICFCDE